MATALQSQQSSRQHRRQHQAPHAARTTTARHIQPLLHRAAFAYEHAARYDNIIVDTAVVVVHAYTIAGCTVHRGVTL